jgi:hypothetical protein
MNDVQLDIVRKEIVAQLRVIKNLCTDIKCSAEYIDDGVDECIPSLHLYTDEILNKIDFVLKAAKNGS